MRNKGFYAQLRDSGEVEVVTINAYELIKWDGLIGSDTVFPILMRDSEDISAGDVVFVKKSVLTFVKDENNAPIFCMRVIEYEKANEDDFDSSKLQNIYFVGKLRKDETVALTKVTIRALDFIKCRLAVRNECWERASIQIVGFQKVAKKIDEIPAETIVEMYAQIKPRKYHTGFELNVQEIQVKENPSDKESKEGGE